MSSQRNSSPKLKIAIRTDKDVTGGEKYGIFVDVTNISGTTIDDISVTPQVIPGTLLEGRDAPQNIELEEVESKSRNIVREMESQISLAYERKVLRELSVADRIAARLARDIKRIFPLISNGFFFRLPFHLFDELLNELSVLEIPIWARQALRIEDWSDVERLEKEVIFQEDENSFLRKTFEINKGKLASIRAKLEKIHTDPSNSQTDLKDVYSLQSDETISFPFKARAPTIFRNRTFSAQFLITYKEASKTGNFSSSQDLNFSPSPSVISGGVILGGVSGFLVKTIMITPQEWFSANFWINLVGAIVLALLTASLTVKAPESKKSISAEDFIGGFILGTAAGLFAETVIDKLRGLIRIV